MIKLLIVFMVGFAIGYCLKDWRMRHGKEREINALLSAQPSFSRGQENDMISRRQAKDGRIYEDIKNAYYDGYDEGYNAGFEAGQRDVMLEKMELPIASAGRCECQGDMKEEGGE